MRAACALVAATLTLLGACSGSGHDPAATASPTPDTDPARPLPSPLPEVVARVNGQPVRFAQVLPIARGELEALPEEEQAAGLAGAVRRALERYIDRELMLQEAQARGLTVDARELAWAYDQARQEYPDEDEWQAFLAEEGLDPQLLKAEIRIQHLVSALLDVEGAGSPVTDEQARRAYDADPSLFVGPGEAPPPFEAVQEDVRAALRRQQRDEQVAGLVERLRARARVEVFI